MDIFQEENIDCNFLVRAYHQAVECRNFNFDTFGNWHYKQFSEKATSAASGVESILFNGENMFKNLSLKALVAFLVAFSEYGFTKVSMYERDTEPLLWPGSR